MEPYSFSYLEPKWAQAASGEALRKGKNKEGNWLDENQNWMDQSP